MTEQPVQPVLVLVGAPGAGKSTVGRVVAERLGIRYRDTDDDVVAAAGKPIADIFIDDGEEHFRDLERAAVLDALAAHDGVLSLGGGAVLSREVRRALRDQVVVLLVVDAATAARRVGLNRDRPVLALNPRSQLKLLLEDREPLYREVARASVRTAGRSPEEVSDMIVTWLAGDRARLRLDDEDADG